MNHIYRLVWNRISRQWVAVAETVRGQRGAGGATVDGRAVAPARALLALSLALAFGGAAWAAPQGGQVVSGSGSIGQAGATTTIRQDSNRLSLDWRSFDVGAGETVRFVQPDARAIAVNRVLGNTASEILGRLQANGQVWLLNPNGILFGRNAQVNVGGLVASTLLAPDGQAGGATTRFGAAAGKAGGSVVNQGSLQAADGGYVALLGHTVSNQGSIVAPKGTVALGAGGAATLTFSDNRLVQLQIDQGTLNDLVENRQLIQADGGRVFMSAGARDSVLASVVNNTGVVQARTVENRGGTIVLLGGMAGGTTTVGGTLDASAPDGGNGGFIETSAHVVDVAPGAVVTTRAARGQSGTWLVDPADYTIAASGGNQTPAQLAAALAAGNVTIASATGSNAASGSGSIFVNGDVSWGSANTLTLNAANNVEVNAVLAATGSGCLTINTASALSGGSPVPGGRLNVNMDRGGRVDLGAAARLSINGNLYGVITTASELASADDSGFWALGSDLSVTALPDKSFLGTFNGLGHSVTNTGLSNPAAMFYEIAEGAVVENLSIRGARVALFDRPDLGILAVTNNGTVRNVSTQGTLFGGPSTAIMGGLVAVNNGSISQSSADATILPSTGSGTLIGGLVGIVQQGGSIDASYATGRIQALASDLVAGGLVGYAIGGPGANAVSITRSFATANVTMRAPGAVAGGLVGIAGANVRIADAYATGSVVGDIAGGLVGRSLGSLERVYATGSVAGYNGASKVGGLVAERGEGSVSHAYWNLGGASQSPAGTGLTGAQIAQRASYAGFDFGGNDPTWVIYEGHTAPLLNVFLKPLTVTSGNQASVVYNAAGSTASLIAPVYSDSAATTSGHLFGTNAAYADRVNAGTHTPNLWSDQFGYRIGYVGGSLTITPAVLTLSGSRAYDGGTVAAAGTFGTNGVVTGIAGQTLQLTGSGTLSGKNAGSRSLALGSLALADGSGLASNYTLSGATHGYTIDKAVISLAGGRDYDAGTTAGNAIFTTGGTLAGVAGETLTLTGSGTVASKNVGTRTLASLGSLALGNGSGTASNYTLAGGAHSVVIDKAVLDLAGFRFYDGGTTAAAGIFGGGTVAGLAGETLVLSGTGSLADKNVGAKALGLGTLAVNDGGNGGLGANYTLAGGAHMVTVGRKEITGRFTAANKTYDATTAATVTGNLSGLVAGDAVTLSGTGTFADKNAGTGKTVDIGSTHLAGADVDNYLIVTNTSGVTADIAQRAITGSFTAADKTYDATTAATVTGSLNGVLGSDAVVLSGTGTFIDRNAGNGKAVTVTSTGLGGADAGNYTVTASTAGVTANIAKLAITGSYSAANKTYDATTAATVTGSLAGVLGTDAVTLNGTGTFADKHAGNGKAVTITNSAVTGADAGNYTVTADTTGVTADIGKLAITGSYTAANKTYDATTAATVTGTLSGVLGTDAVALSGTGTFADKNAGTGKAVTIGAGGLTGADAGNYTVTAGAAGVTADIATRAITGSFTAADKTYDATTAATVTGSLSGVLGADAVALSGTGTFADKNAGTGKAVSVTSNGLSGADAGNYTVTATTSGVMADIGKLAITGSYIAANKTYDATTAAAVTGSLTGVLGRDVVALGGTGTFADKNAGTGKAVAVTSTGLSGADAGNYAVTANTTGVTADITKRAITGSYTAASKTYDATTAATVIGTLSGVLGTDAVALSGTGTFADKNAGTGKAVTIGAGGLTGADAGNYTVTAGATGVTADIAKRAITGSYTAANKTYDATTAATVTGSLTGVLGTDAVSLNGTGTFADKNAGTGKAVAVTFNGLTGADAGNYTVTASTAGVTANIAKLAITGSYTAANKTYDAMTAATVTGSLAGVLGTDAVTLGGTGTFADKNAGTGKAVTIASSAVTGADAGNYTVTANTTGVTANIGKLAITGSYTAANKTYDATTAAAVTGSLAGVLGTDAVTLGGTGTFADKNAGNGKAVTITNSAVTGADAGNYTVTANTSGVTADIAKLAITGSYSAANKTYDATTAAAVTGTLSGVLGTDDVALNGTGTFADKNAGTGKAVTIGAGGLTGADAGNYTVTASTAGVTANIGKLAITGSYTAANKTYDATTTATVTGTLSGVLGTDAVVLSGTGAFADKNAGTGKAVTIGAGGLTGADAGNYTVTAGGNGVTADITKLAITGSYTAANKTYDATTAATVTGSLVGVLGTDAVSLNGTGTFADKNAGTGKAVAVTLTGLGGADAANYTVTVNTAGVRANIGKLAIAGSYSAANKTYDATTVATVTGSLAGVLGTDAVALNGTGAFADKNAGTGKAVSVTSNGLSGADAGNYTVTASTAGVTADIGKLAITGSYSAANKTYDATTAATVTGSLAGVLGTDAVALNGTGAFADKNAGTGKAVSVTSNGLSGADAGNYTVTASTAGVTANIAKLAITGSYSAANKTYDATTAATVSGTLSGVLGTDAVALSGTGTFADKNAGTSKAVTVTSNGLSGADAGNYTVTADATGVTADIAKLAITGNYKAANKVYDATTAATVTGNLSGVLGTDAVALNGTGSFADKNAGTGKAVTVTSNGLSGADAGNYTVTADTTGVTADIASRAITGNYTAANKVYDATTAATVTGNLSGVLGTDAVALNGTGAFADKNAGNGKAVSVTSSGLSGADAGNYTVTADISGVTADIAKRAITGNYTAANKVYDATTAATVTGNLTGVLGADVVALNGTGTFADKNAGTGKAVAVISTGLSGADAGNYTVTADTSGVTADIARRAITGAFTAADKTYDATTAATVAGNLAGVLGTDAVTLDGIGTFADKNAGRGKRVTVASFALGGADAGNYALTANATATADITPKALVLTGAKPFDGTTAADAAVFGSRGSLAGIGNETVQLSGSGTLAGARPGRQALASLGSLALGDGAKGGLAANYSITRSGASVLVGPVPVTPEAPTPEAPALSLPTGAQAAVAQAQSTAVSRDPLSADGLGQADGPSRSATAGGDPLTFVPDPAQRPAGAPGSQVALSVVDGGVRLPADALCVDGACAVAPASSNPQSR